MAFDINIKFSNLGTSPANISLAGGNSLIFNSNDYFIIEPCKGSVVNRVVEGTPVFDKTEYKFFNGYPSGSSMSTSLEYVGSEIGAILRYGYEGFLLVRFDGTTVALYKIVNQSMQQISRNVPCKLVKNVPYNIKIEDLGDKVKLYIDGTYKTNFILDNDIIDVGLFGIYGSTGTVCYGYTISSTIPTGWSIHGNVSVVGYGESQENESSAIISMFGANTGSTGYIYQQIDVTPSSKYSYLLKAGGQSDGLIPGRIDICKTDGTVIVTKNIDKTDFYSIYSYADSFTVPAGVTKIEVRFVPSDNSTIGIDRFQLNSGDIMPFIQTKAASVTANPSVIDLPVDIAGFEDIKIEIEVKPYSLSSNAKNVLYSISNDDGTQTFILYYDLNNKLSIDFISGGTTTTYNTEALLNMMEFNYVQLVFKNGIIVLSTYDMEEVNISAADPSKLVPTFPVNKIKLGYTSAAGYSRANASFDNFVMHKGDDSICNYDFDGGVQELTTGVTIYIPSQPTQFAPISVEYADGTKLQRISSFDENGNYTKIATEYVRYTGQKKVTVSCTDIESEYNPPVAIIDIDETDNSVQELAFPATGVDGNTIYLDITDEESARYIGKNMKVMYVPSNSYSVSYNEDNSFNVTLHSHKGSPVVVSFEQAERDTSLIKSANMNPFHNPNHTGFLYLSDELSETSYLDVTVSPAYIDARVGEYALIIIDAFDSLGNVVPDADINIRSSGIANAEIIRINTGEDLSELSNNAHIDIQFCAGRYIYAYKLRQQYNSTSSYVLKDVITIVEAKTKVTESTNIYIYV